MSDLIDAIDPKVPILEYNKQMDILKEWIKVASNKIDELDKRVKELENASKDRT